MLLSLISKLLAALLVSVITLAAIALLFSQTLLSSKYLEDQLYATHTYSRLSVALADEVSKHADPPDPTLSPKLQQVFTPDLLQQKITLGLNQLQAYYEGTGPAPSIPVDDLKAKAEAVGIKIGDDSSSSDNNNNNGNNGNPGNNNGGDNNNGGGEKKDNPLSKPITFSGNNQIQGIGKKYNDAKWGGVLAALLLAALLLLVSWKRHRWAALPDVLMVSGVLLGLWSLAFGIGPGMAQHFMKFDFNSNALAGIGHDLAVAISHDLSKRIGIVAASYFVIGLAARIYISRRNHIQIKQAPAKVKK